MDASKRRLLRASGLAGLSALGACATANGARTEGMPFDVGLTSIPIVGTMDVFPVRRIYRIGRNYEAHAREAGSDPTREPPFFFQKPTDAIQVVTPGRTVDHPYPTLTKNDHHEIERVATSSIREPRRTSVPSCAAT